MAERKEKKILARVEPPVRKVDRYTPPAEVAPQLDPVIHERLRLGIISALAVNTTLSFGDLKRALSTTDGNLSVHARKLEDAGYIECRKSFQGRVPRTEYSLTAQGRKSLEKYLEQMERIIRGTRRG